MSRTSMFLAGALALALGATANAATTSAQQLQQKQQLFNEAPYTLAGTIASKPANGTVDIKPYGQASTVHFQLSPSVPIYQGSGTITDSGLMPGVAVRMHYTPQGTAPKAMAVEVLTPPQAQLEKQRPQQLVATNATVTTPAAPTTPTTPTALPPEPAAGQVAQVTTQQRGQTESVAQASQAGKVLQLANGQMQLSTYAPTSGQSTVALPPNTPIFSGNKRIATSDVKPGQDVRVYYQERGAQPSAVAVELLEPTQAQQLKQNPSSQPAVPPPGS